LIFTSLHCDYHHSHRCCSFSIVTFNDKRCPAQIGVFLETFHPSTVTLELNAMDRERYTDEEANDHEIAQSEDTYHDDPLSEEETLLPSASDSLRQVGMQAHRTHTSWRSRIHDRIPQRLHRSWAATVDWVKGPDPPRLFTITPYFPTIQHAPLQLLDRYAPKRIHRFWLLIAFYFCWLLAFILIQWKSSFASDIPGYGSPVRLWCGAHYWYADHPRYKSMNAD